jgi:hypothetical protein
MTLICIQSKNDFYNFTISSLTAQYPSITLLHIHRIPDHTTLAPPFDTINAHPNNFVHFILRIPTEMRRHNAARMHPERMTGGQWLGRRDIEGRATQMTTVQSFKQSIC